MEQVVLNNSSKMLNSFGLKALLTKEQMSELFPEQDFYQAVANEEAKVFEKIVENFIEEKDFLTHLLNSSYNIALFIPSNPEAKENEKIHSSIKYDLNYFFNNLYTHSLFSDGEFFIELIPFKTSYSISDFEKEVSLKSKTGKHIDVYNFLDHDEVKNPKSITIYKSDPNLKLDTTKKIELGQDLIQNGFLCNFSLIYSDNIDGYDWGIDENFSFIVKLENENEVKNFLLEIESLWKLINTYIKFKF